MPVNFDPGQGVVWSGKSGRFYGVVTACDGETVEFAPMYAADRSTRCFDEGGSMYDMDRYKVRPRGCPPPFTLTYAFDFGAYGAFIDADPNERLIANESAVVARGMYAADDGEKVPDEVLKNILNPVWRDEKQHAKRPWEDPLKQDNVPSSTAPVRPSPMERLRRMQENEMQTTQHDDYQFGG